MRRLVVVLAAVGLVLALGLCGCKSKEAPKTEPDKPKTIQMENEQVKVYNRPQEVKKEVETTIQEGFDKHDNKMNQQ